jgi:hypothetical protein
MFRRGHSDSARGAVDDEIVRKFAGESAATRRSTEMKTKKAH